MASRPWYKVVTPRREVREGRSFSPDEFAIALEQVVAGAAPQDYRDPTQFFSRTCFTRALIDHAGMVLRRLAGETQNTSPVLTLVTQFGGGKTHTLTALYHLAKSGRKAQDLPGVSRLLAQAGIATVPKARVGVFVGNAWDPSEGCETPWIDLARQLAGNQGVAALGAAAKTTPPGTQAIAQVFTAADGPVLLLFDEVLNFVNRHRNQADKFHAFIQNLTVAVTGATGVAAVISLPRSQVEMTDWDSQWQDRITKVVRRVAQDLIANDEAEIGDVVRRRLFEDLGSERARRHVSKAYADWCFERTTRLPTEWTAVDSATTEAKAREYLRGRFEACYPFHPATLSVFRRKWSALPQFQQTRGALAMLAQWVSWAASDHFREARSEALITLGSAPLHKPNFRAVVLGQLGEQRLDVAIAADIADATAHARALDADAKGSLRDIHRRVGAAILFESSGGQLDKVAHLPELSFALGEPEVETTTIDTAAAALEASGFFIRKVGSDGYRIHHQATLKKVVSDRRAALDEDGEIRPAMRKLVEQAFARGNRLSVVLFPEDGAAVQDTPRLTLVVVDPEMEWQDNHDMARLIARWTQQRGASPRLYPAALVWCCKKPGRELRDRVEIWLAWRRVQQEVAEGLLGAEYSQTDRRELSVKVKDAETAAKDEVWASYRFVALADAKAESDLKVIDLGAGHSSANETLAGRVVTALRSEALLSKSVGAGYLDRHWPPAFRETGAWPLTSLRQSFLNGSLTRLVDPDGVLQGKIAEFVERGDFGLASTVTEDGGYQRLWHEELVGAEEIAFEPDVFLLTKEKSEQLRVADKPGPRPSDEAADLLDTVTATEEAEPGPTPKPASDAAPIQIRVAGQVPSESWNNFGLKVVTKLRGKGRELKVHVDCTAKVSGPMAASVEEELRQALADLDLAELLQVERR